MEKIEYDKRFFELKRDLKLNKTNMYNDVFKFFDDITNRFNSEHNQYSWYIKDYDIYTAEKKIKIVLKQLLISDIDYTFYNKIIGKDSKSKINYYGLIIEFLIKLKIYPREKFNILQIN